MAKRSYRRPPRLNRLTRRDIANAKDGEHCDGGGLYLSVTNNGAGKSWLFRWKHRATGRDKYHGLGSLITVDVDLARKRAAEKRLLLDQGKDPEEVRAEALLDEEIARGKAKTVSQAYDEYFD